MTSRKKVRFALLVHGGAGARRGLSYDAHLLHMQTLLEEGARDLRAGASALDAVMRAVACMESRGLYVAGKGAAPNTAGEVELDASIMDGDSRAAGAVAALQGFVHPIEAAFRVMTNSPHVMLVGKGAAEFATAQDLERVPDPESYYVGYEEEARVRAHDGGRHAHGTVGAVALDGTGRLAAATSTGGIFRKALGRVGDSPIIGAGTWADGKVAVSCTGDGENFMRVAAARSLAARMAYAGETLEAAARGVLDEVAALGGSGGLIAVDGNGRVTMPFNSQGMKCGLVTDKSAPRTGCFELVCAGDAVHRAF